jgi:hypothetical protein
LGTGAILFAGGAGLAAMGAADTTGAGMDAAEVFFNGLGVSFLFFFAAGALADVAFFLLGTVPVGFRPVLVARRFGDGAAFADAVIGTFLLVPEALAGARGAGPGAILAEETT